MSRYFYGKGNKGGRLPAVKTMAEFDEAILDAFRSTSVRVKRFLGVLDVQNYWKDFITISNYAAPRTPKVYMRLGIFDHAAMHFKYGMVDGNVCGWYKHSETDPLWLGGFGIPLFQESAKEKIQSALQWVIPTAKPNPWEYKDIHNNIKADSCQTVASLVVWDKFFAEVPVENNIPADKVFKYTLKAIVERKELYRVSTPGGPHGNMSFQSASGPPQTLRTDISSMLRALSEKDNMEEEQQFIFPPVDNEEIMQDMEHMEVQVDQEDGMSQVNIIMPSAYVNSAYGDTIQTVRYPGNSKADQEMQRRNILEDMALKGLVSINEQDASALNERAKKLKLIPREKKRPVSQKNKKRKIQEDSEEEEEIIRSPSITEYSSQSSNLPMSALIASYKLSVVRDGIDVGKCVVISASYIEGASVSSGSATNNHFVGQVVDRGQDELTVKLFRGPNWKSAWTPWTSSSNLEGTATLPYDKLVQKSLNLPFIVQWDKKKKEKGFHLRSSDITALNKKFKSLQ